MKTPFQILAKLAPPPTAEDIAAAQRLGVTIEEYQAAKLEVQLEEAKKLLPPDDRPADIVREERIARRLRSAPGTFKRRDVTPNILVEAAKTPGEVAQKLLFVVLYVLAMFALVIFGGEKVRNMPGIFQCIALGVLILPVMWLTGRIWEAIGETARDVLRALVRFWPLTLIGLIFVLGALKLLLGGGIAR